jgi:hypothetical protein
VRPSSAIYALFRKKELFYNEVKKKFGKKHFLEKSAAKIWQHFYNEVRKKSITSHYDTYIDFVLTSHAHAPTE